MHVLMVLLLARLMDYRLTAADLLEMVRGDLKLAMELVCSVGKAQGYEDACFLAVRKPFSNGGYKDACV